MLLGFDADAPVTFADVPVPDACLLYTSWRGKDTLLGYEKLLGTTGIGGTDYLLELGGAVTLLNMGLNGLFATFFVLAVGGNLNGPTIGGIFTIVGFSATGKHLQMCIRDSLYGWPGLIFRRRILMTASGQNDSTNYYNRSQRQNLSSFFHNFLHLCLFLV